MADSRIAHSIDLHQTSRHRRIDGAAILRLVRLLVSAVREAGPTGFTLTPHSAVYSLASALVEEAGDDTGMGRTALMALRDLVWRVDTAKAILAQRCDAGERQEIEQLFDTDDVHAFLRQCAHDALSFEKTDVDDLAEG